MQEIINYLASLGSSLAEVKASLAPFEGKEVIGDLAHTCPLAKCLRERFPEQDDLVVGAFPVANGWYYTVWVKFPKENPQEGQAPYRLERIKLEGPLHDYIVDHKQRYLVFTSVRS